MEMSLEKTSSRMESRSSASTLYSSCPVFNPGDFTHPRPPESDKDVTSVVDTHGGTDSTLASNSTATALLLQMFMSELDSNEKGEGLVGVATAPTSTNTLVPEMLKQREVDSLVDCLSPTNSASSLAKATACVEPNNIGFSTLERIDSNGLDDPFLMDFTDISQLLPDNPTTFDSSLSPSSFDRSNVSTPSLITPALTPASSSDYVDVTEPSFSDNPSTTTECDTNIDFLTLSELVSSQTCSPLSSAHTSDYEFQQHTTITAEATSELNFSEELDLEALGITSAEHDQISVLLSSVTNPHGSITFHLGDSQTASSVQLDGTSSAPASEEATPTKSNSEFVPVTTAVTDSDSTPVATATPTTTTKRTSRKRKHLPSVSSNDSESEDNTPPSTPPPPPSKKAKKDVQKDDDKYRQRRDKNNVASQVSRARRKAKRTVMFDRVTELEATNAELRRRVEEMSAEAEQLRKMLVERLAHT